MRYHCTDPGDAVDPDTLAIKRFYGRHVPLSLMPRMYENEIMEDDFNKFVHLSQSPNTVGILSRATDGEPQRSARNRAYHSHLGMLHEMRAALKVGRKPAGFVALLRPPDAPDYSGAEARFLASFCSILEGGLRAAMLTRLQADVAGEAAGTGIVILNEDLTLDAANEIGERWMRGMGDRFADFAKSMSVLVRSKSENGTATGAPFSPHARMYGGDGRWLNIGGSRLLAPGGEQKLSFVIEGLRPAQLHSLLYEAYGFTDRERELLQCVLRGYSTQAIASELGISPYTVQDYFKSIFDKTGVRSRRDLVGKLLLNRS